MDDWRLTCWVPSFVRFQACIMDWHTGWLSQHQGHQPRFAKIIQVDKTSKNELSHGHVLRLWFLSLLAVRYFLELCSQMKEAAGTKSYRFLCKISIKHRIKHWNQALIWHTWLAWSFKGTLIAARADVQMCARLLEIALDCGKLRLLCVFFKSVTVSENSRSACLVNFCSWWKNALDLPKTYTNKQTTRN